MTIDQRQTQTFGSDDGRRAGGRAAVGVGSAGVNAKVAFATAGGERAAG